MESPKGSYDVCTIGYSSIRCDLPFSGGWRMRRYLNVLAANRGMRNQLLVLMVLSALAGATGCDDDPVGGTQGGTFTGPSQTFGNGTTQAFVILDEQGDPTSLGAILSESVLSSLPTTSTVVILALPAEGVDTPFNFVRVNFGPAGHPPPGIYDKPHFDFHFFLITEQEVAAIGPSDPNFLQKGAQTPASELTPPDYVADPVAIPGHGTHWTDPTSPEFQGQPFTATFLYGFYEGRVIHLEPMATSAFLLTRPNFTAAIKLPTSFAEPGLYPTSYSVRFDATAGGYIIALEGLTAR
jgi:hypothetical protein